MNVWEQIDRQFPVRKTDAQKQAFREWAAQQIRDMGYSVKEEVVGRWKHHNLIVGDPEHAAFVFTANYDTPARMLLPNLAIPRNFPLYAAYSLLNVLLGLVPAVAAMLLVQGLFGNFNASYITLIAVYLGILLFTIYGPANPKNANGNTSGLAATLMLMASLSEEERSRTAFILFDNKEKGKFGSKSYAREHVQVMFTRLVFHLDAVGVGDQLIVASTKLARKCTGFGAFERAMNAAEGFTAHLYDSHACTLNSDHSSFKCGVGLTMCRRRKLVGFYTPALRTPADTACDPKKLEALAGALTAFVREAVGPKETKAEQE